MARVSPLTNVHSLRRKRQLVQLYWNECRCPLFRRLLCSAAPNRSAIQIGFLRSSTTAGYVNLSQCPPQQFLNNPVEPCFFFQESKPFF